MGQRGTIEIRVSGSKGNLELSPDTYDIREIAQIFDVVESILFSGNKKQRPDISYSIESGSVRHVFRTSFQSIVATTAILTNVLAKENGLAVRHLDIHNSLSSFSGTLF